MGRTIDVHKRWDDLFRELLAAFQRSDLYPYIRVRPLCQIKAPVKDVADMEDLGCCGPGKLPKSESSRKWLGEGAEGLLDLASKRPLALVRNGVAPVQKRVWVVQKTLLHPLLPGPKRVKKDLLHPPLTTFGDFPFLDNFPGPQHPNGR